MKQKDPIVCDFPMPLETKRLLLRPLQAGDGHLIFDAIEESRPELERFLSWPQHVQSWEDSEKFSRESSANFILRRSMNLGVFKGKDLIGVCGFNEFLWDISSAEIGYWCRTSAQRQGYLSEAVAALTEYGFQTMHLKRIVITCLDENHGSAALSEKVGFDLEVRAFGLGQDPKTLERVMGRQYVKISKPIE